MSPTIAFQCEKSSSEQDLLEKAKDAFYKEFKTPATFCGCAPGRVNLIGEHTDYNDGFVLPMALPMVTLVVGAVTNSEESPNLCEVVTLKECGTEEEDRAIFETMDLKYNEGDKPKWANYVKGVVANFHGNLDGKGFNGLIATNVPIGGGLSSSASLEVAMYTFLEALTDSKAKSKKDKALACQRAEHDFAQMPCGIMDQFVSVMGEEGFAVKIDCRSLEVETVPIGDPDLVILIINSNVKHTLTGSEYPTRRRHCEEASEILGKKSLRDANCHEVVTVEDNVIRRRALHVVSEIARTEQAAVALKNADYDTFGNLMKQSHVSLRDDFEVSCPEVDLIYDHTVKVPGVYGSRMTGGGFGGCTVTLLKKEVLQEVIDEVSGNYAKLATFYSCSASKGAREIKL